MRTPVHTLSHRALPHRGHTTHNRGHHGSGINLAEVGVHPGSLRNHQNTPSQSEGSHPISLRTSALTRAVEQLRASPSPETGSALVDAGNELITSITVSLSSARTSVNPKHLRLAIRAIDIARKTACSAHGIGETTEAALLRIQGVAHQLHFVKPPKRQVLASPLAKALAEQAMKGR